MITKPTLEPEEWVVSLNDVKQLYISLWRRLLKWAFLGGMVAFSYFGGIGVKYRAEATFKSGIEKSSSENLFKELVIGLSAPNQPPATVFMKSNQVLGPLAEQCGSQIVILPMGTVVDRIGGAFSETLGVELGRRVKDIHPFVFEKVHYLGEKKVPFTLIFSNFEDFTVYNKNKALGKGKVGAPLVFENFEFTLKQVPQNLELGISYPFLLRDRTSAIASLSKQIEIKTDKDNASIIHIHVVDRNREKAAEIANQLMREYQNYLLREHDQIAKEQLAYLEKRQEQIFGKMEALSKEEMAYLKSNLEENGFIGLEEETATLLKPHQEMQAKVVSIEVELARLAKAEEGETFLGLPADAPFSQSLSQTGEKIRELKHQRDLIELSLCQVPLPSLETRREELKEIRNQRVAVEALSQEVEHGREITAFDLNEGIVRWASGLTNSEERKDFAGYLENYGRILSLREKMLQERFFYGHSIPPEIQGIDFGAARGLFLEYNGKLDAVEATLRHYSQFKKELSNPHFDLASLSGVLKDPLSQKIIHDASSLILKLKDEKHHSAKEGERWKEEVALHRKILLDHLNQLDQVEALNADLIREKMAGLQAVSLDGINRQISALNQQIADAVQERRLVLFSEKALLEKKMEEIRKALGRSLPEKWRVEKSLKLKTALMNKVMETLTEVVETKTLSNHLHHVESKPLDLAITPLYPEPPHLFAMTFLGAFGAHLILFSFALIRQMRRGFPLSLEKLKALHFPLLGSIGPDSLPPLDLLRNVALFSQGGQVIGLIGGGGADYSFALAENTALRGARSILLHCDFTSEMSEFGLLQLWKKEIAEPPILKRDGYDYILSGGATPYAAELIQSPFFIRLMDHLKKNYDWIYLFTRTPLSSAESVAALQFCDKAVVTVSGEQTEELTPFIDWGYDEKRCRLTFIAQK